MILILHLECQSRNYQDPVPDPEFDPNTDPLILIRRKCHGVATLGK
jgi:hypothetical protein